MFTHTHSPAVASLFVASAGRPGDGDQASFSTVPRRVGGQGAPDHGGWIWKDDGYVRCRGSGRDRQRDKQVERVGDTEQQGVSKG